MSQTSKPLPTTTGTIKVKTPETKAPATAPTPPAPRDTANGNLGRVANLPYTR